MQPLNRLIACRNLGDNQRGWLNCGQFRLRCAVGKNGFGVKRREGDGLTPVGLWPLRYLFYRPDRIKRPKTGLPLYALRPRDGWCDDPADKNYNQPIKLPAECSHETLWREDHLYDLCVVVGFNDRPVKPNRGSAIFIHLAKPGYLPTEGCIALGLRDMRYLLAHCNSHTLIEVR